MKVQLIKELAILKLGNTSDATEVFNCFAGHVEPVFATRRPSEPSKSMWMTIAEESNVTNGFISFGERF